MKVQIGIESGASREAIRAARRFKSEIHATSNIYAVMDKIKSTPYLSNSRFNGGSVVIWVETSIDLANPKGMTSAALILKMIKQ